MTKPKAAQLEANTGLPPLARDWIKAIVAETAATTTGNIQQHISETAPQKCSCSGLVDDLLRRIEYLEHRADADDKYVLTKGKLIEFMKKSGIA